MKQVKELLSGPQFFQFLIFVLTTVLTCLTFEQSLQHVTVESLECLNAFALQLILIYVLCYFGNNITVKSSTVAISIYNIRWYYLPLQQQKMIGAVIRQGQVPYKLDGFKIFSSSLETFAEVRIEK